jgi:diaminohydroxyphosphoribosylaminopyrimidine deaminase/5-amino-6-(5-phosphoribosylamino)uracil reductase
MRRAIALGQQAQGMTGDNPAVGAVLVRDARVLGEGHTQPPHQPHAEVMALRDAEARGESTVGATLYTTVEPCCFHGRTPACTGAILGRGIARVVVGIRDPHPRVDGRGIAELRAAGISVSEDILADEVRAALAGWLAHFPPR